MARPISGCDDRSMPADERPAFELSSRLRRIRDFATIAFAVTLIAQWLGASFFDKGFGFGIQAVLVAVVLAITAYDFVKLGRRRTPSRW